MSVFPDSNWKKFESHSFHLQNPCILQTKTDQKKGPRKMNFDNFEIQEFISENSKSRWKNGVICLVLVLKLPKIVQFLQI